MPPKAPALDVIRECPRAVILGSGLRLGENISYYIITTFSITYLTEVAAESHSLALNAILIGAIVQFFAIPLLALRSEEHTSELQSLMRISYAVFCLKTKTKKHLQNQ